MIRSTLKEARLKTFVAFMLEQRGMTRAELALHMGGKGRVSEFFSGKRHLRSSRFWCAARRARDTRGSPDRLIAQTAPSDSPIENELPPKYRPC